MGADHGKSLSAMTSMMMFFIGLVIQKSLSSRLFDSVVAAGIEIKNDAKGFVFQCRGVRCGMQPAAAGGKQRDRNTYQVETSS